MIGSRAVDVGTEGKRVIDAAGSTRGTFLPRDLVEWAFTWRHRGRRGSEAISACWTRHHPYGTVDRTTCQQVRQGR